MIYKFSHCELSIYM